MTRGAGSAADLASARAREVLRRLRAVPEGFVTTYGDISPGSPRFAGSVLSALRDPAVPWQRVVRADGSLAKGERQRLLLEDEGVPFAGARVDMDRALIPVRDLVD
jgi:alkylated DNA nucleotide flippase Atl1